jgi:hypothetical protein
MIKIMQGLLITCWLPPAFAGFVVIYQYSQGCGALRSTLGFILPPAFAG